MNDQVGFNLRAEYVGMNGDKKSYFNPASGTWTNLTTVTEVKSVMDVTVGGQYKFNDNVKAKLDLSYVNASTTGGTKPDPFYIANAGVVANF